LENREPLKSVQQFSLPGDGLESMYPFVPTYAVTHVTDDVIDWMLNGRPGGIIVGTSRSGKTAFANNLPKAINFRFKRAYPAYVVGTASKDRATERDFFENICIRVKNIVTTGTASALRFRLVNHLVGECIAAGVRMVILIFDNAHRLTDAQLLCLCTLFDDLFDQKVQLFTILIGEPPLAQKRQRYAEALERENDQSLFRFMEKYADFPAVRSIEDVEPCLEAFDTKMRPPGKVSYSASLMPQATDGGWTMKGERDSCWPAIVSIAQDRTEFSMQYVMGTIIAFIRQVQEQDEPGFQGTRSQWKAAAKAAYLTETADRLRRGR
jgi:hypothetical protein